LDFGGSLADLVFLGFVVFGVGVIQNLPVLRVRGVFVLVFDVFWREICWFAWDCGFL